MFKEYLMQYRDEITEGNPNNGICFDGAVNQEKYFAREKRLMFLLKETNGNKNNGEKNEVNEDWDYMEWVRKQADPKDPEPLYRSVFRNIAMWSKMFNEYADGLSSEIEDFIDENGLIINDSLCAALENIAIVNLKKSWGVEQTDWNEMKAYLEDSNNAIRQEILHHQVETLKPTFVLCGGTFEFAQMIFGKTAEIQKKSLDDGSVIEYFTNGETTFVRCYHPSRPGWSRTNSFLHVDNIFRALPL